MKIVFLGTGGTYPSKARNVTSIAIKLPGEVLMFDCGEGTQRQLMRSSVSFMKISKIFVTHLHADHFLGLPGLIQSMSLNGRESELEIFGPRGLARNVRAMLSLGYFKCGFSVRARDIEPGRTLEFGAYKVRCAKAEHTVPSIAYSLDERPRPGRFDVKKAKALGIPEGPLFGRLQRGLEVRLSSRTIRPEQVLGDARPGRRVVYTGDTRPCRSVRDLARNADVLIHDCTLTSEHSRLAAYFGHSTAVEAGRVAKAAKVGTLFLVHISPRHEDHSELEREARKAFKRSFVATDLLEFSVPFRGR
jgi:ribonuclease Z